MKQAKQINMEDLLKNFKFVSAATSYSQVCTMAWHLSNNGNEFTDLKKHPVWSQHVSHLNIFSFGDFEKQKTT